jgi:membrane protein implicated in regulation of membrane protease activity
MFVLVALTLLLVLPHPWNVVGFGLGLAGFSGELAFWNRKVRGNRAAVGAQTLIGQLGTVVTPCFPTGQIRIGGEIWAARCEAGAAPGETITVIGRDRLTLIVQKDTAGAQV